MADEVGYKILAASGLVGDSGLPIALYGFAWKSDGTAGVATFRNGTSGSATAVFDATGTASTTVFQTLPSAPVFPSGLYVSMDAHVTTLTAFYRQVLTA